MYLLYVMLNPFPHVQNMLECFLKYPAIDSQMAIQEKPLQQSILFDLLFIVSVYERQNNFGVLSSMPAHLLINQMSSLTATCCDATGVLNVTHMGVSPLCI